jgi:[acyl-carrier-protein] S-malonyltransferase
VIALVAPGQGAQSPGMLAPWLESPGADERIGHWSEAAELDLKRLGTTADAGEIQDTAVTQPLIVALSLLVFEQLMERIEQPADLVTAGHSVGELTAVAIAGVLSSDDAVALAAARGREMARACAIEPTGMAAVLGGEQDEVLARLDELGLEPANRNAAGQVVAAGPVAALDRLGQQPPARAKIRRLAVAGAFHTRYMAPARQALAARAEHIAVEDPRCTLLSNADGAPVGSGEEALRGLVAQVTAPVRWDACMAAMRELRVTATIELSPAGTLTGMIKRELKGMKTLAIKKPADLDTAVDVVTAQAVGTIA